MKSESILAHIEAFRRMIIEILVIFVILLIPCWLLAPKILQWMQQAALRVAAQGGADFDLSYFALMEPFLIELKCAAVLALAAGLPLYFWRIWVFVAPALYRREKRVILFGSLAVWGLFSAGFALGLFGVMPMLVKFSLSFAREGLTPVIGLGNFISMTVSVALAFGVMFEFPLLLLVLAAAGIIKLETLRKQRPVVVIVILFLAALLTPPDVVSQLMLGVPTYLLFELMLLCGKLLLRENKSACIDSGESNEVDTAAAGGENAGAAEKTDMDSENVNYGYSAVYHRQRRRRQAPRRNKRGRGYISNG